MDFTVGIFSRNLATMSSFVEFRDSRNMHVFRGNEHHVGHLVHIEWHTVCHVSSTSSVHLSSKWGPGGHME